MEQNEQTLYAGFHKLVITPPMGLKIPGYFSVRISDGIETDLHVRAVAFAQGEKKAVIISCEAITAEAGPINTVKELISQRCGVEEACIYIHCVHSHTAFRMVSPEDQEPVFANYLRNLFQRITDCAQFAFEDLKPATIRYAKGQAQGVGFIRTYRMKDGSYKTNPGIGNPDVVEPIAQQDESVQLVRIVRQGAKEILLTNFGTHADTIGGTKYCADWPGYLCDTLEAAFDGQVQAMTLVGAEGNSNHVNVFQPKGSLRKGVEMAKKIARVLAGEVLKIYDSAVPTSGGICGYRAEALIGKNDYDPADVPEAMKIRDLYVEIGDSTNPVFKNFKLPIPKALRIVRNLSRPEFFHIPVYGLKIGGIGFIGMPCEPFQSIGMAIKEASKMDMTVVTCLTNGSEGYFPDAEAFRVPGSYEQMSSPYAPDCAEKLAAAAISILEDMN